MPRPHGVNTRIFSQRSRAVVLEAEWMVMTTRIANELKPLVKLAKDQGWTIEAAQGGTKLVWRGPKGEGPVYTGYRTSGRDLQNHRAELIRAGLKMDERTAKEHLNEESMQALLEQGETATSDQIMEALTLVGSAVATLCAKAEMVDESRKAVGEWRELTGAAEAEAAKYKLEAQQDRALIDAIRQAFSLAPWAILPEIAKLLGIDATGPAVRIPDPERIKTNG